MAATQLTPTPPRARARPARRRGDPVLGLGLVALAAGLAVLAALGPLLFGAVEYHVTETLRNQTIGLDAVSLGVVAPLAVAAAVLALRGHAAGAALALPVGAYTAYMQVQYIVGPDYTGLPGDNEVLVPLNLALLVMGWTLAARAWVVLGRRPAALDARRRRLVRVGLPLLAGLAFVRYLPALADAMGGAPADGGYLAGPTFFWTIAMLDLGVALPLTVAAWAGLGGGRPWAPRAVYGVLGWFALVGVAVAGMAVAMLANGDPNASVATTLLMVALGAGFAALAVPVHADALRRRRGDADGWEER